MRRKRIAVNANQLDTIVFMIKDFLLSEKKMMGVILLNALVIWLLYFPQLHDSKILNLLDYAFILIFLLEALEKLRVYKPRGYFEDPWNVFDFIIVVISLPSLLGDIFPFFQTNLILLLRLFRLVRLIKFIKFVPHITSLLEGVARAIRASVLVLAVLFFLNFMLALFSCHFYGKVAPEYFGNPLISSYSIFQMFTIEGWNEIPATIGANMDPNGGSHILIGLTKFFFVIIVLVGGIFGMSLANAIFVDEMTIDNNQSLEKQITELQKQLVELKEMLKERQ